MAIQKILVVDDSKTELHHLTDLLTRRGYNVRTAENGDEAMRRLTDDKPDLILMDVVMPGQNGFQLDRGAALLFLRLRRCNRPWRTRQTTCRTSPSLRRRHLG